MFEHVRFFCKGVIVRYLLLGIFCVISGSDNGMHHSHVLLPRIYVETSTRVLDNTTSYVDDNNNLMVSENQKIAEVILKVYQTGRPVKVITLNVDL